MSVLESLLGNVLEISLALAAVIAALLILRPLLMRRYRSRLYYQIWLLVAVRLIIPLNFSLPDPPVQVQAPAVTVYHVESARSAPAEPRYRALTEEDYLTEVQETASRTAEPVSRIQAQYTCPEPATADLSALAGGGRLLFQLESARLPPLSPPDTSVAGTGDTAGYSGAI